MANCIVETSWGEINREALFVKETGLVYFRIAGGWLNYEPCQVANYKLFRANG